MEFPLTVDLGANGGLLRFRTTEDVTTFVDRELEAWKWLPEKLQYLPNPNDVYSAFRQAWSQHFNTLTNMRTSATEGNIEQIQSGFDGYFKAPSSLPVSDSVRGAAVQEVRRQIGDRAGIGALAVLLALRFDGDDPDQVRGILAAHGHLQNTGTAARQSLQNALSAMLKRLSQQQLRVEEKADALDYRIAEIEKRRRTQFARILQTGARARKAFSISTDAELERIRTLERDAIQGIQTPAQEAIESIRATEKVYSEHMGLKGPVTYWTKKADEHRVKSWVAGSLGLAFAGSLTWYLATRGAAEVLDLVKNTVKETGQWQLAYVVLTMVLFLLTIAFWIGRLISRVYVSQSHLALDAAERATMVQTYLALTNENKISDAERILVLGALFRTSEDGLVKDDASPDMSVAGLLSKFAAGSAH